MWNTGDTVLKKFCFTFLFFGFFILFFVPEKVVAYPDCGSFTRSCGGTRCCTDPTGGATGGPADFCLLCPDPGPSVPPVGGPGCSTRGASCTTPAGCCGTLACNPNGSGQCAGCNTYSNTQSDCETGGGSWGDPGIRCFDSGAIGSGVYCGGSYNSDCYTHNDQASCQGDPDGCLWDGDPSWAGAGAATCSICSCGSVIYPTVPPTVPPLPPNLRIVGANIPDGNPGQPAVGTVDIENTGGAISNSTRIYVALDKQRNGPPFVALSCGQGNYSESYFGHGAGQTKTITFNGFNYPVSPGPKTAALMVDSNANSASPNPSDCNITESDESDNGFFTNYTVNSGPPNIPTTSSFQAYGGNVIAANSGGRVRDGNLTAGNFIVSNISPAQPLSAGFVAAGNNINNGAGKYSQQNGVATTGWNLDGVETSNRLVNYSVYDQLKENILKFGNIDPTDYCNKHVVIGLDDVYYNCYTDENSFGGQLNAALNSTGIIVLLPRDESQVNGEVKLDLNAPIQGNRDVIAFIPNNLNISNNVNIGSGVNNPTATFVVDGQIELKNADTTDVVDGVYISTGGFNTRGANLALTGHGSILVLGEADIEFKRNITGGGVGESWFFEPKYLDVLTKTLARPPTRWRELSPQ